MSRSAFALRAASSARRASLISCTGAEAQATSIIARDNTSNQRFNNRACFIRVDCATDAPVRSDNSSVHITQCMAGDGSKALA